MFLDLKTIQMNMCGKMESRTNLLEDSVDSQTGKVGIITKRDKCIE